MQRLPSLYGFLASILVLAGLSAVCSSTHNAHAAPLTFDLSTPGDGPFDQHFFAADGLVFTKGSFVGFVQGDDALIFESGGLAGAFAPGGLASLSVQIAPAL